ncbi:PAQR family membrane homeostasis protein TrhA [Paenibacillus senegalensis]|uniref:PAQR family membrane homeostasis protein TrhA n=1 Tax=Paenibacillus senegalensis TaxID=1465766 RepID=UPI000288E304|nr:hemolysin III family protein [Paenibacillus senegalensis]
MMNTWKEEAANTITHGIGVLCSIAALVLLIIHPSHSGEWPRMISFTIYGVTLVLLYLASTLLHAISRVNWKKVLRTLDHSAIYLLIAGTYTPYMLVTLNGWLGWTVLGFVWLLAVFGIVMKIFCLKWFARLSTLFYLLMGWAVIIVIVPLSQNLALNGLLWLIIGGLLYTLGSLFYVAKKLPYSHAIWHVFVLAGSVAHFISIYYYV